MSAARSVLSISALAARNFSSISVRERVRSVPSGKGAAVDVVASVFQDHFDPSTVIGCLSIFCDLDDLLGEDVYVCRLEPGGRELVEPAPTIVQGDCRDVARREHGAKTPRPTAGRHAS